MLFRSCDKIFYEKSSGVKPRKELNKLLGILKEGDSLVVTRLDRLGRTLKELLSIVEYLSRKGVHFISVIDKIDTSTSIGRLFFHINAVICRTMVTVDSKEDGENSEDRTPCIGS